MNTPELGRPEQRFRDVYTNVYDDALRYALRRLDPPQAAEDAVAEAMLTAWRRVDDLPPTLDEARAWVFGIVRRTILTSWRTTRRSDALGVRIADHAGHTAGATPDGADEVAARLDLAAAWEHLTDDEQDVIALTALDGLTSQQAAAVLGITPNAYRLRLSRARRELRRLLQGAASDARAVLKETNS